MKQYRHLSTVQARNLYLDHMIYFKPYSTEYDSPVIVTGPDVFDKYAPIVCTGDGTWLIDEKDARRLAIGFTETPRNDRYDTGYAACLVDQALAQVDSVLDNSCSVASWEQLLVTVQEALTAAKGVIPK